jgi:two-component system, cell cycle sensor histidine kinase and response regulator CckA
MARQTSDAVDVIAVEAKVTIEAVWRLAGEIAHDCNPRLEEREEAGPVGMAWAETSRGGETVLVVDDEAAVRSAVWEILQLTGYIVLEAGSGEEALRISAGQEGPIPLLLTDVMMPVMSGPEVAQRLACRCPEIRVLYMSGYSRDAIIRHGVVAQGTAFLQKPFTPDELMHKVREVLDAELTRRGEP